MKTNSVEDALMLREDALVLRETAHGIATITLNSPANFNALSSAMIAALREAIDVVAADEAIRVVVLAAHGKAFCAGHDLREMRGDEDEAVHRALFERCSKLMMAIEEMPQPVIAKVHGIATAAGCQLAATCDLIVASHHARFATSGINLGLFCSTPAVALTRAIAQKHAAEMLFTGEFIEAERAYEIGFINRLVRAEALDTETYRLAEQIAAQSRRALASGKRLLRSLRNANTHAEAYELAAKNMACDMQSGDARAGIDAFLNKQAKPRWAHR